LQATRGRVAILGAGIMGASLALNLARRGREVVLFDRADAPVTGASRWNEGKIHLGYLYGADPTLETARRVLAGGLAFGRLVSELIDADLSGHVTIGDDLYLVHRRSVVDAETLAAHFDAVDALVRAQPDARGYLDDVSAARSTRLAPGRLAELADPDEIVAGFSVPERSVNTLWLADRLAAALEAELRIELRTGVTVTACEAVGAADGAWRVRGTPDVDERFDKVVNALWEGRLEIDLTAGLRPDAPWSHRYRRALFARTCRELTVPCAVVAVGPFGDVKNYDGRNFYLSWYPAGLVAEGTEVTLPAPPPLSPHGERELIAEMRLALEARMPWAGQIFEAAEEIRVVGGYVFAQGQGSLADPRSTLHRRDRFGVRRLGNYLSVDTGKYSTAPWLALNLADEISPR
jgi:glycine/D-amino acid oxidase-like deaminating enzyme